MQELLDHNHAAGKLYLQKDRALNTAFAFGTLTTQSETVPGGHPVCKLNGELTLNFSDLLPPAGQTPLFAQAYVVTAATAVDHRLNQAFPNSESMRRKNLDTATGLIKLIEEELRKSHPFASLYKSAYDQWEAAKEEARANNTALPSVQLTLLNNREAKAAHIADPNVHPHRTELPVGVEHVGLVWISATGKPPKFSGIRLAGKEGHIVKIPGHRINSTMFATFFPLLNPKGILGYRWGIPLKGAAINADQATPEEILQNVEDDENNEVQHEDDENNEVQHEDDEVNEVHNEEYDEHEADSQQDDHQVDEMLDREVQGWTARPPKPGPRQFVSQRQFWRYLIHPRGRDMKAEHWLFSHEQLAEYFLIVINNHIERYEMDYRKSVQEQTNLRSCLAADLIAGMEAELGPNATIGKVFMPPNTWPGSRPYMQNKYANLKTIVDQLGGRITWFITFTGNSSWPEIANNLDHRRDESNAWIHNALLVCRVFNAKFNQLMHDVCKLHFLGKGKIVRCSFSYLRFCFSGRGYSIEFQKRGMPHAHILIVLEEGEDTGIPDFVDQYVSAEIPDLPADDNHSLWAEEQRRLHKLVTSHMLHDCGEWCVVGERCSKRFPKPESQFTILPEDNYPMYRRRLPPPEGTVVTDENRNHGNSFLKQKGRVLIPFDNRNVVPYNDALLKKYNCHINIEYVGATKVVEYCFKYVMKGGDRAYIKVTIRKSNLFQKYKTIEKLFRWSSKIGRPRKRSVRF
ncbi:hypothetical protein L596_027067 [Steinernema carpocapsae]|uniref:Helitron helicase-like domain-containing protein n=1 Tax=Steinernema carpocapsae TaxID=34508 RepID=A0A4U5M396_STECR|nr:hypothetical protein L596_027067 [Steinernema carpocapsae]